MPAPNVRVESVGSIWLIDEYEKVYCRMPKVEGPRLSPVGKDWGGPGAGALQDLVWHDFIEWYIATEPVYAGDFRYFEPPALIIKYGERDTQFIGAPNAVLLSGK